jgi:hypothetical protein
MSARSLSTIAKHVWTEPKFVAQIEWGRDHPSLAAQLMGQVPRKELEEYVDTGQHPNPDRRVSFVMYDEPDWDWWEPRYDQPWRRQAARDRELDALLATR